MVINGEIKMSPSEWEEFEQRTFAPWKPRTPEEFNAMCDLASIRHGIDNTAGMGELLAKSVQSIKFGAGGEINFPEKRSELEYIRIHGEAPSPEQLAEFEGRGRAVTAGAPHRPSIQLV